jgi:multidrug efflux pump
MKDIKKEFGPSSWAIDNKTAIYVLIFMITVLGLVSYNNLPKENFPDIAVPKILYHHTVFGPIAAKRRKFGYQATGKKVKIVEGFKKGYIKLGTKCIYYYS